MLANVTVVQMVFAIAGVVGLVLLVIAGFKLAQTYEHLRVIRPGARMLVNHFYRLDFDQDGVVTSCDVENDDRLTPTERTFILIYMAKRKEDINNVLGTPVYLPSPGMKLMSSTPLYRVTRLEAISDSL